MSKTSKEMCTSVNSDAIDAITGSIKKVGIIDSEVQICANCGKEGSDVKNKCNKCNAVMYCNAACKKKHRHKHKKDCEEYLKRAAEHAAELHDEKLFKQPPPKEDCPICMIRLPTLGSGSVYMNCCGKIICKGCIHAFQSRITKRKDSICPFCRTPFLERMKTDEEIIKRYKKRMELNDATALYNMGCNYSKGFFGLPRDHAKSLELWHRAGELGNSSAYFNIGNAYKFGEGVERDNKKTVHYYELAAMRGCVYARHNLGCFEFDEEAGNMDRALKHYQIAVKCGDSTRSLESIKRLYLKGYAAKDEYAKALKSHQAYLDEIKNDQRDEAAAFKEDYKYYESA